MAIYSPPVSVWDRHKNMAELKWIACNCSFVCHINIWRNMDALPNVPVNHGFN
jgi:hypothetical protein